MNVEQYAIDRRLVIKLLSPLSIDQIRFREPPAAFRVNLVPEELHDVRGRCADASVNNSILLGAERVVTKSSNDKLIRRLISGKLNVHLNRVCESKFIIFIIKII